MRTAKSLWLIVTVSLICLAATPPAAIDDASQLIQIALEPSPLENNLRHLTDEIGGRVPGTPAMERAVRWGMEKFKAAGADEVHTEDFSIAHGWSEGSTRIVAKLLSKRGETVHRNEPPIEFPL